MSSLRSGTSRSLVEKTELTLNIHIHTKLDPNLAVGSRALIQEMKQTGELTILLKPDRQDHQYLIAQGCMSALATRNEPFSLRSRTKGEQQFRQKLADRGLQNSEKIAAHLTTGTGTQLRGAPLLAQSALVIYSDYPDLRRDQRNYFKLDCAEGALALSQAPKEFEGELLSAHLAMNGAMALVADYLFQDTNFYQPYVGSTTDSLATSLVNDLYGVDAISSEKEIVSSWVKKLSLGDFYEVIAE